MKHFIFAILLASAFSFSAMPGVALAKHHPKRHYHYVARYRYVQPADPPSDPRGMNSGNPRIEPQVSAKGNIIVHPSDCDLECYVKPAFADTSTTVTWRRTSAIGSANTPPPSSERIDARVQERFALSPDTNVNDYYVNYVPPNVVTVGGFSVPVRGNPMYYSPFKHGRNGFWDVHNRKGVDVTADYGVSPRAGPLPESIGGSAYTVTTVER